MRLLAAGVGAALDELELELLELLDEELELTELLDWLSSALGVLLLSSEAEDPPAGAGAGGVGAGGAGAGAS